MKTIVILFLLTFGALSFPIGNMTLEKKVETSDLILEGTVIKSHSFFDKKMFFIFTYNEILVSKLFKGTLISDTVGIITPGGALDGHAIDIADCALQGPMTKGKVAIFFVSRQIIICLALSLAITATVWLSFNMEFIL